MRFKIFLILIVVISGCHKGEAVLSRVDSWVYQLQNANPEEIVESNVDLIVMDYSRDGTEAGEYSQEDINMIKESGILPIAYISIGEAENYRFYWEGTWEVNPPDWLGKENSQWPGNYAVKFWSDDWKEIVFSYIDRIIEQGFSGLYLDKVDEYEYWCDSSNNEALLLNEEEVADSMVEFIQEIKEYCTDKKEDFILIPQNGEGLIQLSNGKILESVSGWGVKDLFYSGINPVSGDETNFRIDLLERVCQNDKIVLSVDYVDDGSGFSGVNKQRIEDYIQKARGNGFIPYAARSDRNLDELNLYP